jgi:hypothetical protein
MILGCYRLLLAPPQQLGYGTGYRQTVLAGVFQKPAHFL